jgi:hypothetical protein
MNMTSPYKNMQLGHTGSEAVRHGETPYSAIQGRLQAQGINRSLGEEAGRRRAAEAGQQPLKFTERAMFIGASLLTAPALAGVLWAGIHANHEANNQPMGPVEGTHAVHPGQETHPGADMAPDSPGEELRNMVDPKQNE